MLIALAFYCLDQARLYPQTAARTAVGRLHFLAPLHCTALHAETDAGQPCTTHAACPTYPTGPVRVGVVDPSSARPPCPCAWHLFRTRRLAAVRAGRHCWHVRACQGTRERYQAQRWSPARARRRRGRSSGGQAPPRRARARSAHPTGAASSRGRMLVACAALGRLDRGRDGCGRRGS